MDDLALQIAVEAWDHWKLYKHGVPEPQAGDRVVEKVRQMLEAREPVVKTDAAGRRFRWIPGVVIPPGGVALPPLPSDRPSPAEAVSKVAGIIEDLMGIERAGKYE